MRFSLALRGYRMSEVDALLARLAQEQEQRCAGGPRRTPIRPAPNPVDTWRRRTSEISAAAARS